MEHLAGEHTFKSEMGRPKSAWLIASGRQTVGGVRNVNDDGVMKVEFP